jgi:3-deoxy-7-phosphoheptulonate synthase
MIDCSHGNSQKQHRRQINVAEDIAAQIKNTSTSDPHVIRGVMIESHLIEGRQDIPKSGGRAGLNYGQSVTDACIGWEDTVKVLNLLRDAVKERQSKIN